MSDLISRQAAIDAVNTALFPKINTAKDAEKALRNLPSAQPELPEWAQEVGRMYNKALCKPYIRKPLAWALHEVWKEYDREVAERRTDE